MHVIFVFLVLAVNVYLAIMNSEPDMDGWVLSSLSTTVHAYTHNTHVCIHTHPYQMVKMANGVRTATNMLTPPSD